MVGSTFTQVDNYLSNLWAINMSRPGTLIIADNVIRGGKVLDAQSTDEKVIGVRAYNQMVSENDRVVTSILQQVGQKEHDGIAISLVK